MRDWLTKEQFAIARSNGIASKTLYHRYYKLNWDLEKALTVKPGTVKGGRKSSLTVEEREILKKNGVSINLFTTRLYYGWTRSEALNTKKMKRGKRRCKL